MGNLPEHGRIPCIRCFQGYPVEFNKTKRTAGLWRITNNPLAWGGQNPEVIVLGFSKGPNQIENLDNDPHDQVAYKGGRTNVVKILSHLELLKGHTPVERRFNLDRMIENQDGNFHFGSLIRCTVERFDQQKKLDGHRWRHA